MPMKRSLSVALISSCVLILCISVVNEAKSMQGESTHSIFIERFSNTNSPLCLEEQTDILTITEEWEHRFHIVDFHLQDKWSTFESSERAAEFNITLVPSYVYDGGYDLRIGETLTIEAMEDSAGRVVHKIGLSIDKEITEQKLMIECVVVERNGFPFNGEVIVYIVENHLTSGFEEWNNVFRDYAMKERVELKPNSKEIFTTEWSVPANVNLENIGVIAAVYEIDKYHGSYFVQSACDEDEKIDIPEFSSPAIALILAIFIAAIFTRRIFKTQDIFVRIIRSSPSL